MKSSWIIFIAVVLVVIQIGLVSYSILHKKTSDYECSNNADFEKAYNQYDMCRRAEKVEFSEECLVDALETHCEER